MTVSGSEEEVVEDSKNYDDKYNPQYPPHVLIV